MWVLKMEPRSCPCACRTSSFLTKSFFCTVHALSGAYLCTYFVLASFHYQFVLVS